MMRMTTTMKHCVLTGIRKGQERQHLSYLPVQMGILILLTINYNTLIDRQVVSIYPCFLQSLPGKQEEGPSNSESHSSAVHKGNPSMSTAEMNNETSSKSSKHFRRQFMCNCKVKCHPVTFQWLVRDLIKKVKKEERTNILGLPG